MPPGPHRRTQSLLLIQRLLALREGSSPLNLVVDNLEQSAGPLVSEYIRQATSNKDTVIYVSAEALKPPPRVTHFIQARRKTLVEVQQALRDLISKSNRSLIIIDSVHPFLPQSDFVSALPSFTGPTSSLVIVYHENISTDDPLAATNPYAPSVLTALSYLATTVNHVQSMAQAKAKHDASVLSRAEPVFGLEEDCEGVLVGKGANSHSEVLVEMEHRRKSGRAVGLSFVLRAIGRDARGDKSTEPRLTLREDHPAFKIQHDSAPVDGPDFAQGTFNLELTEKQRQAREGVVLPYFDAQTGGGQGGRILYDMDREDDFDEEEDEI